MSSHTVPVPSQVGSNFRLNESFLTTLCTSGSRPFPSREPPLPLSTTPIIITRVTSFQTGEPRRPAACTSHTISRKLPNSPNKPASTTSSLRPLYRLQPLLEGHSRDINCHVVEKEGTLEGALYPACGLFSNPQPSIILTHYGARRSLSSVIAALARRV